MTPSKTGHITCYRTGQVIYSPHEFPIRLPIGASREILQILVDFPGISVYYTHAMKSTEIIAVLKANGWYKVSSKGSHHHFKHPTKPGKITVAHPKGYIPEGTRNNIFKMAGLKKRSEK